MLDPLSLDMRRTILVPLDGSACAERALVPAGRLARRIGGALRLVTAIEPALAATRAYEFLQVNEYLQSVGGAIGGREGVPVRVTVLEGPPPATLARYVAAHGIHLVVMTMHGRSGLTRLGPGSVAVELIRRAPAPVLLLPIGALPQPAEFRRVLVAVGEDPAEDLLEPLIGVDSLSPETQYLLVHVADSWEDRATMAAAADLRETGERWRERGLQVATRVIVGHGPGEQILRFAALLKPDLVVVGARGGCGDDCPPLGHVTEQIIYGARQPVLVLPSRGPSVAQSDGDRAAGCVAEMESAPAR